MSNSSVFKGVQHYNFFPLYEKSPVSNMQHVFLIKVFCSPREKHGLRELERGEREEGDEEDLLIKFQIQQHMFYKLKW